MLGALVKIGVPTGECKATADAICAICGEIVGQGLLWANVWPLIVIGVVSIPLGLAVFKRGEIYAKKHGKLKRSG